MPVVPPVVMLVMRPVVMPAIVAVSVVIPAGMAPTWTSAAASLVPPVAACSPVSV